MTLRTHSDRGGSISSLLTFGLVAWMHGLAASHP
jgi:hypothetical protein